LSEGFASLGFESSDLTYDQFLQMQAGLKPELLPVQGLVEKLRLIKEETELELLRTAARIGDQVFTTVCQQIKAGMQEAEIANLIVTGLKNGGCSREAFETIAVAGVNAALPHGQPGDYRLQPGDMLTMDFGGLYQGYAGDMTRTVAIHHAIPNCAMPTGSCWRRRNWGSGWYRRNGRTGVGPKSPGPFAKISAGRLFCSQHRPRSGSGSARGATFVGLESGYIAGKHGSDRGTGHLYSRLGRNPH
jgi:hypothetical protein